MYFYIKQPTILLTFVLCAIVSIPSFAQNAYYIKSTATGSGNGSSWDDALPGDQLATKLATAQSGDIFYVAAGTYYPTTGTDRTASFVLKAGVEIYGGYPAGATGTVISVRDWKSNVTRLSGDIGTVGSNTDNSYNVVRITGTNAILNGFYVSEGYADGTGAGQSTGGGIYGSVAMNLSNLVVENNAAKPNIVYKSNARGGGGGIYAEKTLVLDNAVIKNNSVSGTVTGNGMLYTTGMGIGGGGGIFTVDEATLENVTVEYNQSTVIQNSVNSSNGGGGICAAKRLTLNNSTVSNNTSSAIGGGILAALYLTLNESDVEGNKAETIGGGIYVASTLNLNNSTVAGNRAEREGGGIYTALTQTMSSMAPTITSSTVTHNSAGYAGGGVYAKAHLALKGTNIISNNKAGWSGTTYRLSGDGGGIYSADLTLNIADTLICNGNIAGGNGGGIYKTSTSNGSNPITVTDLKLLQLDGNESKYAGGGIYSTVHIDFSKIPKGSSISGNRAGSFGGGVAVGSTSGTSDHLQVIKLSNITINDNTAAQYGGGIYAPGPLTISGNTTVSGNKAGYNTTTQTFSGNYHGGGIYAKAGLTLTDSLTCEGNGASGNGGGIYKVLTIDTNNPFYSTLFNTTGLKLLKANDNVAKAGGGIYTTNSVNLGNLQKGSSISRNTANSGSGGGIFMAADTTSLTLNNTAVNNNTAKVHGGGIYVAGASTVINSTVSNNTASNYGGGIFTNGSCTINNSTINNNIAAWYGGGIYTNTAATELTLSGNDTISNNKAGWDGTTYSNASNYPGGGVYVRGKFTVKDTLICNNNKAAGAGGGIYKMSTSIMDATGLRFLQLNNNEAGKGTASNGYGGGAYFLNSGNPIDFSGAATIEVRENSANNTGGGIYAAEAILLKNATIIDNMAICHGGGIYAENTLTLKGETTIEGNRAGWTGTTHSTAAYYGGGIYAIDKLILADTLKCRSNAASSHGGGIYKVNPTATIDVTNLKFLQLNNNEAGKGTGGAGGGAYLAGSATVGADFTPVTTVEIIGNTASGNGGGIYSVGTLSLSKTKIINNVSAIDGGGIFANADFQSNANTFANNKAVNGGGVYINNTATIINNTFSANTATTDGGAVYANRSAHNITLSTFNGNTPSAVYLASAANQTFNGNILYGNGTQEVNITPTPTNYNIVRGLDWGGTNKNVPGGKADSIFAVISSGDIATLADNGGPTPTLNILKNGIAYNFIPTNVSWKTPYDQRSIARPNNTCKIDAGAVELETTDDDPVFTITKSLDVCDGAAINLDTLYTITNVKDTAYYWDAAHTQEIASMPVTITTDKSTVYIRFTTISNCEYDTVFNFTPIECAFASLCSADLDEACEGETVNLNVYIKGGTAPYTIVINDETTDIPFDDVDVDDNGFAIISVTPDTAGQITYILESVTDKNGKPLPIKSDACPE